jgi:excinuclease ABC subunit B
VPIAADIRAEYNAQGDAPQGDTLDVAIATAREQMERAAKELDFMAAAKFRDLMYELQRQKEKQK